MDVPRVTTACAAIAAIAAITARAAFHTAVATPTACATTRAAHGVTHRATDFATVAAAALATTALIATTCSAALATAPSPSVHPRAIELGPCDGLHGGWLVRGRHATPRGQRRRGLYVSARNANARSKNISSARKEWRR